MAIRICVNADQVFKIETEWGEVAFEGVNPYMVGTTTLSLNVYLDRNVGEFYVVNADGMYIMTRAPWKTGETVFHYQPKAAEVA